MREKKNSSMPPPTVETVRSCILQHQDHKEEKQKDTRTGWFWSFLSKNKKKSKPSTTHEILQLLKTTPYDDIPLSDKVRECISNAHVLDQLRVLQSKLQGVVGEYKERALSHEELELCKLFKTCNDVLRSKPSKPIVKKHDASGSFAGVVFGKDETATKNYFVKNTDKEEESDMIRQKDNLLQAVKMQKDGLRVPSVISFDVENNSLTMKKIKGMSLREVLDKKLMTTEAQKILIARDLLHQVEILHKGGMFHRDIKPENIIVDRNRNTATLIDYGFATKKDDIKHLRIREGTPNYMSPELYKLFYGTNKEERDQEKLQQLYQRADLWALGKVILEIMLSPEEFKKDVINPPSFTNTPQPPRNLVSFNNKIKQYTGARNLDFFTNKSVFTSEPIAIPHTTDTTHTTKKTAMPRVTRRRLAYS